MMTTYVTSRSSSSPSRKTSRILKRKMGQCARGLRSFSVFLRPCMGSCATCKENLDESVSAAGRCFRAVERG